jgi:predicted transcriptional regulator
MREAQLMEILWSQSNLTADQIRELLPDRPHDSTVRTMLRILESKGHISRVGSGRPLHYKAVVSRSKAQRTAVRDLLGRLFGGSPTALALRLLEDRHLTLAQIEEIARNSPGLPSEARPEPLSGAKPEVGRQDDRARGERKS